MQAPTGLHWGFPKGTGHSVLWKSATNGDHALYGAFHNQLPRANASPTGHAFVFLGLHYGAGITPEGKMFFIEWTVIATGATKRTQEPIESATALKLFKWLNSPNAASRYSLVAAR
jgi:hypothetical protein